MTPHPAAPVDTSPRRRRGDGSATIGVLAACMALSALSIDLLLPAFADMRSDLGLAADSSRISLVVTAYFLGLGVGQLVFGPLSDRFGRKPTMYVGLGIFVAASGAAMFAPSLGVLLACRFFWGVGASAPRSVALAMARDTFAGERLARSMSLIVAIYVLTPVFAPPIGTLLLGVASWRAIIAVQMLMGVALAVRLTRLTESLAPQHRRSASLGSLAAAAGAVLRSRRSVSFGLAVTFVYGILVSYIGGAELLIDEVFGQGDHFAVIFSIVAVTFAGGSLLASRLVMRLGTDRLVRLALVVMVGAGVVLWGLARLTDGKPPMWAFLLVLAPLLASTTIVMPAANAGAMEPVPHVAGMAAALVGTVSTVAAAGLGALTDEAFDGTVGPFSTRILLFSIGAAVAVFVIGRPARTATTPAPAEVLAATPDPI